MNISLNNFKPTRNWKRDSKLTNKNDMYIESVLNSEHVNLKNAQKYSSKEIEEIKRLKQNPKALNSCMQLYYNAQNFETYFDMKLPRLHFMSSPEITKSFTDQKLELNLKLIKDMCIFANSYDLIQESKGCHICVCYHETKPYVNGYVQLGVDECFKLHPQRDIFIQNFQKVENYSIST
jgi:hypothetical protein